ncbi:hypothetical protein [Methylobacterium symbioticum]|uniref:Uncharacterized protein n=1 Tax=Methylobacterium symbioticum TaxID=2584084 RepID=A0A509EM09_9HYPH|nr:hypothetical protein [Methylobacterium symbioticum]VUD74283.1 hypothetical protein MET9862_04911 [Methylobacterium symbioticum]
MHGQPHEVRPSEAERIALAYRLAAEGDAWAALLRAVEDALADLAEAERRSMRRDRLVSRGYVRAGLQHP